MSLHIEQVCIHLKIRMMNSAVGRPQGRGKIERFFETINEGLLLNLPGFSLKGKAMSKSSLDKEGLKVEHGGSVGGSWLSLPDLYPAQEGLKEIVLP